MQTNAINHGENRGDSLTSRSDLLTQQSTGHSSTAGIVDYPTSGTQFRPRKTLEECHSFFTVTKKTGSLD